MRRTTKWWLAAPLAMGLIVAACGGDDESSDGSDSGESSDAPTTESGGTAAVMAFGDEEFTIDRMLCYFEEQERVGLGGVWTHTAQGQGTTVDGEPVVVGLDRARDEDGTVEDVVRVDIGEPSADDTINVSASGPEGTISFGEDSVAVGDLELSSFGRDPVTVSLAMDCG